jgi:two-component system NarL family sensor kinase
VHRELLLVATFLGMGAWEILELWLLEPPRHGPWSLVAHGAQVAVILAATAIVLKLWKEKAAREATLARLVETAAFVRDEERRRVGYDLHDGIAPLIVSAQQHLDTCRDTWPEAPDGARQELERAATAVRAAIIETRRVFVAFRPAALDSTGLADALRTTAEDAARAAGCRVRMHETLGAARLPEAVEAAAFRIAQEAIQNARRHARCSELSIELHRAEGWLTVAVADDGVGFATAREHGGLGLSSMRERARLVGGRCTVTSAPGRGTRLDVRLPCP